jgi:C4-dicarboxylate-specific signal transduction histidine kinase
VEITVRDRGPGIPKDTLDHLFIPFFTTKPKGTGLGLAVLPAHRGSARR